MHDGRKGTGGAVLYKAESASKISMEILNAWIMSSLNPECIYSRHVKRTYFGHICTAFLLWASMHSHTQTNTLRPYLEHMPLLFLNYNENG